MAVQKESDPSGRTAAAQMSCASALDIDGIEALHKPVMTWDAGKISPHPMRSKENDSGLLVVFDVRINEIRDVVAVLFLLLEEGVIGRVVLDFHIVGDNSGVLFLLGRNIIQRHDFGAYGLDVGFVVNRGDCCARGGARRGDNRHEGCAAFGAKDGIAIEIEKFCAAALALALAAEIGFGHLTTSLKANAAIFVS